MLNLKKTVLVSITTIAIILFTGCLPPPVVIDITAKNKVVLVSFAMDKTISAVGGEENTGPGLLQRIGKSKEESDKKFFKYEQESVDAMWRLYKENIKSSLLNASLIEFDEVMNNNDYQALTKHVPKVVMGKDMATGSSMLSPEKMNYVSSYDTDKLDSLGRLFNADLLVLVDNKINYDSSHATISINISRINVMSTITLYEPGKGELDHETFKASSDEKVNLLLGVANPKKYEAGVISATNKLFPKIEAYFKMKKERAAEQASVQTE